MVTGTAKFPALTSVLAFAFLTLIGHVSSPAEASLIGPLFQISDKGTFWPHVAYSPVVKDGQDVPKGIACNTTDGRCGIGVTRLQPGGATPSGYVTKGTIVNSDSSQHSAFDLSYPSFGVVTGVAYSPYDNAYFITWNNGADISGRKLSSTGMQIGGTTTVFSSPYEDSGGELNVRSAYNEYLQVSVELGSVKKLKGQRFSTDSSRLLAAPAVVFDDPLTNGKTVGVRDHGHGEFVADGWKVASGSDSIRYTSSTPIEDGAVEFDVTGLKPGDQANPVGQLMCMYDASSSDPRNVAQDAITNPWSMVWYRHGKADGDDHEDEFRMAMNTGGVTQFDAFSRLAQYPWDPSLKHHFKVRWRDGVMRFSLNDVETDRRPFYYREVYRPAVHDIRIGTNACDQAITGAVYSNVKVYDYGAAPGAPYITSPARNGVSTTLTPVIDWTGDRHDAYEVRVTGSDDRGSDKETVWVSGQVKSKGNYTVAGDLSDDTAYYAHVRLHNDKGWGAWSEAREFRTSTGGTVAVAKYGEYEIALTMAKKYSNPYTSVTLSVTFRGPTKTIVMNGFWDGGNLYKIRMMPTEPGEWTWKTESNDADLDGKTGSFVCQESSNKGYVRVSRDHPHTFEWAADGTPFFLMGDTIWHMWYNLRYSDGSFQQMIDARAAQHFNYAHGVVYDWSHNEGGGICRRQDLQTGKWDCDTLSPAYFQWLDKKIDYMNSRQMVAGLFFAWGNEGYLDFTYDQWMRYIKYLVARYASKNVFWIIAGEYEEVHEPIPKWIGYMNAVYADDPYKHPISTHCIRTTDKFGDTASHSFISQQRKGGPEELRQWVAKSRVHNKPVVNLEYGYEGDSRIHRALQGADDVRKDHYAIVLAGGCGVYGNYRTFHVVRGFDLTGTESPGARYMKILYEFFSGADFHRLSPAQQLVDNGICAAWENTEYIIQLPSGGSVTVDLLRASGNFKVDWFDPSTGARTPSDPVAGGAKRSFTAPDNNDWILHIHSH